MTRIKKIGVLSAGKILGLLYLVIGLIIGAFMTLFAVLGFSAENGDMTAAFFGVGAIIVMPVFYGIMGFIGGIISAFFYNLIAGWIGGLEIKLEKEPMVEIKKES